MAASCPRWPPEGAFRNDFRPPAPNHTATSCFETRAARSAVESDLRTAGSQREHVGCEGLSCKRKTFVRPCALVPPKTVSALRLRCDMFLGKLVVQTQRYGFSFRVCAPEAASAFVAGPPSPWPQTAKLKSVLPWRRGKWRSAVA
jgi:hypothetical protein